VLQQVYKTFHSLHLRKVLNMTVWWLATCFVFRKSQVWILDLKLVILSTALYLASLRH